MFGALSRLGLPGRLIRRLVRGPVKPRLVLSLLLAASLGGVWLAHAGDPLPVRLGWWATVVLLGILAGGLYWRLWLFDRGEFEDCQDASVVLGRWNRVEYLSSFSLAVLALLGFALGIGPPTADLAWPVFTAALVLPALVQLSTATVSHDSETGIDRLARYGCFVAAVLGLGLFAWLETGSGVRAWAVRLVHLGAVALWLGGATWHNAVVVPTFQQNPDFGSPLRAQARRFRQHLPGVIAVLFATGAYQTVRLVGPALEPLLTTPLGYVVSGKLLILAVLTGLVVASLVRGGATEDATPSGPTGTDT